MSQCSGGFVFFRKILDSRETLNSQFPLGRKVKQKITFSEAKRLLTEKLDQKKLAEENPSEDLTPDSQGFFTLSVPLDAEDAELPTKLEEDIAWYEIPVSILPLQDPTAGSILEVKMKQKDLAIAAFLALKDKYPGLQLIVGNN